MDTTKQFPLYTVYTYLQIIKFLATCKYKDQTSLGTNYTKIIEAW